MPNTRASFDLAVKIKQIGTAVQRGQKDAVFSASMIIKNEIEGNLVRAIGSDQRMSNLKKRAGAQPQRLSLGFTTKGVNNPTSLLIARGPWGLVEYGAVKHKISPKVAKTGTGKGMSRANRKLAIRQRELDIAFGASGLFAGKSPMPIRGSFRYQVDHPGSRGKYPFHRGLDSSRGRAVQELRTVVMRTTATVIRSGRQVYTYASGETGMYAPTSMFGGD